MKILIYNFLNLYFLFVLNNLFGYSSDSLTTKKNDSIVYLINQTQKSTISNEDKIKILKKVYISLNKYSEAKKKCEYLSQIAFRFYKLRDTIEFTKTNREAYELAKTLKDTFTIADTHWNYALHFHRDQVYQKSFYHYNMAYKFFEKLNMTYESGRMLYGMAFIKGRYRDFQESETLIFQAIKKFKIVNDLHYLYASYNHLGQLQKDIKIYDKALFYYNKSFGYFKISKKKNKKYLGSYNNIANIYLEKKEFKKAIEYYNKDLLIKRSRRSYATILNNISRCKLLMNDTLGIRKDFFTALNIRDSLDYKLGVISSKISISDYYKYLKDTITAIQYSTEANSLAKQIKNGGDYLTTLKQLANLDVKNSKKYLDRYIVFNDSLISEERKARNKFTRIEFETDEYIEETEKLTEQNLLITISSIGTILVLSLLYFIRVQNVKNEKLRLEADQQKANEEVYVLTLQQQAKLEEERVNERNRISAELHDGVLGKLFGTRVNLGFLGMQMNSDTQEKHQTFLEDLQVIEKEIRDVSHKLSENFDDSTVNFSSIIAQLLKDKSNIGDFKYVYIDDKTIVWKSIDEVIKANVYRIIQESLQNIIKHAKAKKVILEFSIVNASIIISLKDDGVGFNTKKSKNGIGLKNIKSRIKKLNGTLVLTSKVNKGTLLSITIPYITNESKNIQRPNN